MVHQWTVSRQIEDAQRPEVPRELAPAERKGGWRRADLLAGQMVWVLLKNDAQLEPDKRTLLEALVEKCVPVSQVCPLALEFHRLFTQGDAKTLDR